MTAERKYVECPDCGSEKETRGTNYFNCCDTRHDIEENRTYPSDGDAEKIEPDTMKPDNESEPEQEAEPEPESEPESEYNCGQCGHGFGRKLIECPECGERFDWGAV